MNCWSCGAAIDAGDNFCRRCGSGQGAFIPWYYHPAAIGLLFFVALGPFVLPLLWRTPKLGREAKWVGSVLVVALTLWLIHAAYTLYNTVTATLGAMTGGLTL